VAIAVAIWPPGSRVTRCKRCFEFEAGNSATTASRSTLLRPKPATSNGRAAAAGMLKDRRTPASYRILFRGLARAFQ
jgi:hypothetical protein